MSCVRWPMRSTISPPKVLTVRSNSEMWRVISAPSVPESRANFSTSSLPWFFTSSSNALICSESLSCAVSVWLTTLATSEFTVTSSASLALSPEVMMWVARRLPASSILLTRSPLRSSSSSSSESEEFFSGVVHLFGAVGNAVDDGRRTLLELAGDAVDALVQHLVDAIGEVDELVMDVAGLEVEAGGQPLRGVEHGAGGLGAGFLEAVEQVAAALAERQDHVVAGMAERGGDVGAALFQRAGDAFRDFVDARGDRVRDQRDVVAQVDLHAGNGAANLLGLADQIVALMGDVLQQRADAHFVVGIGALERGDFIGHQRFEFAGARDRAFDAVAHRRDLAADRLSDRHHRVGGGAFGLGEADRDLRHRLRDHPHFLAAPGEAGEEIEQQHRCKEQRGETAEHQHAAALSHRGLQRRQEADGQKAAADQPDAGKDGGKRIDAAGRAALLDGLQNLSDGFAIVVGGATAAARLLDRIEYRPLRAGAGVERCFGEGRGRGGIGRRRDLAVDRIAVGVGARHRRC